MMTLSFVLEASFIALVGIGLGAGAGVLLGQAIIGQIFSVITAGRALSVPWGQTGVIVTHHKEQARWIVGSSIGWSIGSNIESQIGWKGCACARDC